MTLHNDKHFAQIQKHQPEVRLHSTRNFKRWSFWTKCSQVHAEDKSSTVDNSHPSCHKWLLNHKENCPRSGKESLVGCKKLILSLKSQPTYLNKKKKSKWAHIFKCLPALEVSKLKTKHFGSWTSLDNPADPVPQLQNQKWSDSEVRSCSFPLIPNPPYICKPVLSVNVTKLKTWTQNQKEIKSTKPTSEEGIDGGTCK